ncbi:MAG TPA: hypothetical protein VGE08_11045 [Steroidobacter sp.]|uniref:hypothetical protein n=1 Tax=Steroidobacter sp. TaxID=1978227 RepID=UPI002EDB35DC
MLLDEPPEEPPPPLEPPEEPEEPPEEPPLGMLDGMEDEEDCWAQPPIRNAETEPMATQWPAIVSRRRVVIDELGPAAEAPEGCLGMSSPSFPARA